MTDIGSMFGFQTNPQGVGTEHLCAFAIQQERICAITEKPWTHSFVEPGCALVATFPPFVSSRKPSVQQNPLPMSVIWC